MKKDVKTLWITLAAVLSILFLSRALILMAEGEEGRLKRTVYRIKRLAEKENLAGLADYISAEYADELENDRRSLLFIAKTFFDNYKNIVILINTLDLTVEGEDASLGIEATVYWQEAPSKEVLYDTAKVKAAFKNEAGRWKLKELKFFENEKKRLFHPMIG